MAVIIFCPHKAFLNKDGCGFTTAFKVRHRLSLTFRSFKAFTDQCRRVYRLSHHYIFTLLNLNVSHQSALDAQKTNQTYKSCGHSYLVIISCITQRLKTISGSSGGPSAYFQSQNTLTGMVKLPKNVKVGKNDITQSLWKLCPCKSNSITPS